MRCNKPFYTSRKNIVDLFIMGKCKVFFQFYHYIIYLFVHALFSLFIYLICRDKNEIKHLFIKYFHFSEWINYIFNSKSLTLWYSFTYLSLSLMYHSNLPTLKYARYFNSFLSHITSIIFSHIPIFYSFSMLSFSLV